MAALRLDALPKETEEQSGQSMAKARWATSRTARRQDLTCGSGRGSHLANTQGGPTCQGLPWAPDRALKPSSDQGWILWRFTWIYGDQQTAAVYVHSSYLTYSQGSVIDLFSDKQQMDIYRIREETCIGNIEAGSSLAHKAKMKTAEGSGRVGFTSRLAQTPAPSGLAEHADAKITLTTHFLRSPTVLLDLSDLKGFWRGTGSRSRIFGPVGMQGHSWDSAEKRLTLCSTILLHGEGPVPNLTAGRHSQACGKANARDTDSSGLYSDSLLDTEGKMSPQGLRRTEEAADPPSVALSGVSACEASVLQYILLIGSILCIITPSCLWVQLAQWPICVIFCQITGVWHRMIRPSPNHLPGEGGREAGERTLSVPWRCGKVYKIKDWDEIRQHLLTDDLLYRKLALKPFSARCKPSAKCSALAELIKTLTSIMSDRNTTSISNESREDIFLRVCPRGHAGLYRSISFINSSATIIIRLIKICAGDLRFCSRDQSAPQCRAILLASHYSQGSKECEIPLRREGTEFDPKAQQNVSSCI
ncbi:hypothetical protein EYF80_001794 [Liparis tanakae]|uniref:Uncharacterized protein n=1 Tax=Liparis tanakae TaxID=230148 RepID=A0A4Z2JCE1_9TELE|nr:hypothetical protein EYF80_001794 [Liparis tanakae]